MGVVSGDSRGVLAVGFSPCQRYISIVEDNDTHRVTIYNLDRKCVVLELESSKSEVTGLAWSKRPDDLRFAVVGPKEIQFWHPADVTKKLHQKGVFLKATQTNLMCVTFDDEGWCYTGGENGIIQVWGLECSVARSVKTHATAITALATEGKRLVSSSKD